MGNANHVEKETDQPERKKERKNKIKGPVYAEIVSEEQSKSGVPPLKVLLHEQLTSSAIDSLRDSHAIANDLAKKLSLDILKEPETLGKFGQLLGYIFAYESVLYPTRLLIYWSIGTDVAFKNAIIQTKWQIGRWQRTVGPNQVNYLVRNLLQNDDIKKLSIKPLIKMVFEIEAVKQPLTNIIVDVLPHAQTATARAIKYSVMESLKSEQVRKSAKDGILYYLKRVSKDANGESGEGDSISETN